MLKVFPWVPMQFFFRRPTALYSATALDWRVGAIVLTALISSQGCGTIAETPNRAVSTREVPPAESQPRKASGDKPPPAQRSETSPIAKAP